MSKAISSYPDFLSDEVVVRRINGETKGLGYWAAIDYTKRKRKIVKRKIVKRKIVNNG